MKIICIGKNYLKHIEELNSKKENEPVIFLKPDTSIIQKNNLFLSLNFQMKFIMKLKLL